MAAGWSSNRSMKVVIFAMIIAYVVLFVVFASNLCSTFNGYESWSVDDTRPDFLENELIRVGKFVIEARKHARSSRTLKSLNQALDYISEKLRDSSRLDALNISSSVSNNLDVENRTVTRLNEPDVCPEVYKGKLDFERGWEFESCQSKALDSLVTLVLNGWTYSSQELYDIFKQIRLDYPKVRVVVSVKFSTLKRDEHQFDKNIDMITGLKEYSWYSLIKHVRTKYLVVLRDVHRFSNQSRIERLISVSSRFNVPLVGGATVGQNGHWWHGCYQMTMKNYSLTYEHGYDFSRDSCWFCDHLSGPFLARTDHLKRAISFLNLTHDNIIFSELFVHALRRKTIAMSCPDVMFHVRTITIENAETKQSWLPLAKEQMLIKINSFTGATFSFSCQELSISCAGFNTFKGKLVAPCCFELLNVCIKAFMKFCIENNVFIDIRFGTLLGALKFKKSLPWDIDADFQYYTGNHSTLIKSIPEMNKLGCSFSPADLYGTMDANGWYVDVTRVAMTPSLLYRQRTGQNQTYVLYDGMWVKAPPNPGRILRIEYKYDIFQHANSRRHTGLAGYVPGSFVSCPNSYIQHSCLDQYYVDGSLQFTQT